MAKYLIKMKDNHIGEWLCNNESDLATIKIEDFYPGTTAYCIANKKTYILDEDKTWAVYDNNNNNNNNQEENSKKAIEIRIESKDKYYGENGEEDPDKWFRHCIEELVFTKNEYINDWNDYYGNPWKENRDLLNVCIDFAPVTTMKTFFNINPKDIIKIYGYGHFTYWYEDESGEEKTIIKKPYVFIMNDEWEATPVEVTYNIDPENGWQEFTCEIPASEFFKSNFRRLDFTFDENYEDV